MAKRAKNYKELQFLLDGQVARHELPPPVQSRLQVLPLSEISWENFERLCARLITKDGAIFDCYRYGKPGEEQQGIDILARRWIEGKLQRWVYQCKRYASFKISDVDKAISSFHFEADVYVILLSAIASTDVRDEVLSHPNVQLWDREDISRKLKEHPTIVADFFSRHWQSAFIGEAPQPPADSTQIAIRRAIGIDLDHKEWLHSNLLPVLLLPEKIYQAPTPLRPSSANTPDEIAPIPPYKYSKGKDRILSLANLKDPTIAALVGCEESRASFEPVEYFLSWAGGRNIFRDLFYEHLRHKCFSLGMAHDDSHHRFYFTPENGTARVRTYRAFKRTATRKLAYPYEDKTTKEIRFWVHHAARLSLIQIDQNFYLEVEPGYAFTQDGQKFMASEDIGPLTTRRKSGERNQNVFNHLIFWSEILANPPGNIAVDCGGQEFTISKVYESAVANFGIPYDSKPLDQIAMAEDEFDLEMMIDAEVEDVQDGE